MKEQRKEASSSLEAVRKETIQAIYGECWRISRAAGWFSSPEKGIPVVSKTNDFFLRIVPAPWEGIGRYKYPGENGYNISLEKRNNKEEPRNNFSQLEHHLTDTGFIMVSMYSFYYFNAKLKGEYGSHFVSPLKQNPEVKKEFPLIAKAMKERVAWFRSQGSPIQTISSNDYYEAERVLDGEMPPAIVPNQKFTESLLQVLKRAVDIKSDLRIGF